MNANAFSWIFGILLFGGIAAFTIIHENKKSRKESKLGLLHLIIMVICADGKISEKERSKLGQFCKKNGISEKQLQKELKSMHKVGGAQFKTLVTHEEAVKNINILVDFMKSDGSIDEDELTIVKNVAQKYGLGEDYVDNLLGK